MKSVFVKELEENKVITTVFVVQAKEIRQKKTGEPYLSLLLADRTGEIEAKMFDNAAPVMDTFDRDDFVKVKGLMQIFHNRPQITIHTMQLVEAGHVDFRDYFPSSERSQTEMWTELRAIVGAITNPHLSALLNALLDDEEIATRFRIAPAAKQIHHAFLGGLIEHVLSICHLCKVVGSHYKNIDVDLMIAGAVLHDIGKIYELTYERGFGYSTEGQLLGHMAIALRMMGDKLRALPDFPSDLRNLLEHMVLSHHGHLEYGSAKVPVFPEAMLLHQLDDLDSKMESMRSLIEKDRFVDAQFTAYSHALERSVLKKAKYLERDTTPVKSARVVAAQPAVPRPPATPVSPKPASVFADKLLGALQPK